MDETGKIIDVLILDSFIEDQKTGIKSLQENYATVWADTGFKEIIKSIPGITNAFTTICETKYEVYFDPRYDREFLKEEIKARILCA